MQSSSIMEDALKILYEDNHLIAVFKPHRILSQGDETGDLNLMDLTKSWLKEKYHKPGNVFLGLLHRLDRPVAGIVLFAKTSKGASRLSAQIRDRQFKKTYLAWVEGDLKGCKATRLDQLLTYDEEAKRAKVLEFPSSEAQRAVLDFRWVRTERGNSLLEINLETGRKHQIRAQLAFMGHPVLGDTRYGAKQKYEHLSIGLVASEIEFSQPTTQEKIIVKADASLFPNAQIWRK